MLNINCILADDEPLARQLIKNYIEKTPWLTLNGIYKNAWQVQEHLESNKEDLLFLDIEMPGLDGLTFIKSLPNPPHIIFITAYRDYAVEAFEVNALDYLLKPVSFERFLKALRHYPKALEAQYSDSLDRKDALFISVDRQMVKVLFDDILYLEAMGDYVKFYTGAKKPLISKMTLKDCLDKISSPAFIQIHRSFIINKSKVQAFTHDKLLLGEKWLKISRSFQNPFDF